MILVGAAAAKSIRTATESKKKPHKVVGFLIRFSVVSPLQDEDATGVGVVQAVRRVTPLAVRNALRPDAESIRPGVERPIIVQKEEMHESYANRSSAQLVREMSVVHFALVLLVEIDECGKIIQRYCLARQLHCVPPLK